MLQALFGLHVLHPVPTGNRDLLIFVFIAQRDFDLGSGRRNDGAVLLILDSRARSGFGQNKGLMNVASVDVGR